MPHGREIVKSYPSRGCSFSAQPGLARLRYSASNASGIKEGARGGTMGSPTR